MEERNAADLRRTSERERKLKSRCISACCADHVAVSNAETVVAKSKREACAHERTGERERRLDAQEHNFASADIMSHQGCVEMTSMVNSTPYRSCRRIHPEN